MVAAGHALDVRHQPEGTVRIECHAQCLYTRALLDDSNHQGVHVGSKVVYCSNPLVDMHEILS